jgi:A/G-specific adenine glycosylase
LNSSLFSRLLISWYEQNKRDLPWRSTLNPYFIWLSEIILQQTRVNQGLPYYEKFIKQYPTIETLAKASEEEVLRLWQGLGYYSRARNMHSTAKSIQAHLDGIFPDNYKDILKLKGIGKYTAGAIASFAFKEVVPVVDGNVYRVLSRVFGMEQDISSPKGQKEFLIFAESLLPKEKTDLYNQAVMEFGATVCLPKNPICEGCIFRDNCFAFQKDMISVLPVKTKKLKKKERQFSYFVIKHQDKLLMHRREGKDIWKGLYQFYLKESHSGNIADFLPDPVLNKIFDHYKTKINEPGILDKHVLTHQVLRAKYWEIEIDDEMDVKDSDFKDLRFYSRGEVEELPKPILIHNYLSKEYF